MVTSGDATVDVAALASTYWAFASSANVPYVYVSSGAGPPFDVGVGFDNIFSGTPSLPKAVGAFTVQAAATPALPFTILAKAQSGIWEFDPLKRHIRADFDALLLALEQLGLKPGRLALIRGYLAQSLPQTFAETLYFRHGFDPANRYVDLTPGMRLRVDFAAHQSLDPEASPLNGFVGAGTTYVDVTQVATSDGVATAFDPFLAALQGLAVPAAAGGASGALDLQTALTLPYRRLMYPSSFTSSDGPGAVGTAQNAVLVAAPTWADMQAATQTYLAQQTVPSPAVAAFFRGRAVVVPEIPALIQGELRYVPLGTTIRGLLAGFGPVPWLPKGGVQFQPNSSQGYRRPMMSLSMSGGSPSWSPASYGNVGIGASYGYYASNLDSFDLPVLGGDSLMLQTS